MARGRKTSLTIRPTPAERQPRRAWQRATPIWAGLVRRARVLLLVADGMTITEAAATVGLSRRHAFKWLSRFRQEGVAGLEEKRGRGSHLGPLPPYGQHDLDVG
jgi:CRP-like cAMP-binding protein